MKPIRTLEERLLEMAEMVTWETFENTPDGNVTLSDLQASEPLMEGDWEQPVYTFHMRVGLHLERPTQAVMAAGKFLKMRRYEASYQEGVLAKLDPAKPDVCLYSTIPYVYSIMSSSDYQVGPVPPERSWRPFKEDHTFQQQMMWQYQQGIQQQYAQGLQQNPIQTLTGTSQNYQTTYNLGGTKI